jgi:hypothetical protein
MSPPLEEAKRNGDLCYQFHARIGTLPVIDYPAESAGNSAAIPPAPRIGPGRSE